MMTGEGLNLEFMGVAYLNPMPGNDRALTC